MAQYTTIKINKAALNAAVLGSPGMPRYFTQLARETAHEDFVERKEAMLREVDDNPISREIEGGNTHSGSLLGYGNLFSYIGFNEGTTPVRRLYKLLDEAVYFDPVPSRNMRLGRFYFKVYLPDREEIGRETREDLGSLAVDSWPHAIEEGLTNLSQYLYDSRGLSKSNSGTGLQLKHTVREREFPNLSGKYITAILAKVTRGYLKNAA